MRFTENYINQKQQNQTINMMYSKNNSIIEDDEVSRRKKSITIESKNSRINIPSSPFSTKYHKNSPYNLEISQTYSATKSITSRQAKQPVKHILNALGTTLKSNFDDFNRISLINEKAQDVNLNTKQVKKYHFYIFFNILYSRTMLNLRKKKILSMFNNSV